MHLGAGGKRLAQQRAQPPGGQIAGHQMARQQRQPRAGAATISTASVPTLRATIELSGRRPRRTATSIGSAIRSSSRSDNRASMRSAGCARCSCTSSGSATSRPKACEAETRTVPASSPGRSAATAKSLLGEFGRAATRIVDLGDITTARGTEQLLPIWIRLWGALGTADFNFAIVKA